MSESVTEKEDEIECVCMCACVRERERERESRTGFQIWFVDQKILHRRHFILFSSLSLSRRDITNDEVDERPVPMDIMTCSHLFSHTRTLT